MIDDYDHAILELVQRNNQMTHAAIGELVCLSPSAVRRRLKALRESGVIRADISIIEPPATQVTIIVVVRFQRECVADYQAFREQMIACPEVTQCYSVAAEIDFILVVLAKDLATYESWGAHNLMSNPAIRRYDSHVVYTTVKAPHSQPHL